MWDDIYTVCDRGLQYPIYDGVNLEGFGSVKISPISGSTTDIALNTSTFTKLNFNNTEYDPSFSMKDDAVYTLQRNSGLTGNVKFNFTVSGTSTGTLGHPQIEFIIKKVGSASGTSLNVDEINQFLRQTYSQLDKIGEKSYTLEETWVNFANGVLSSGDYEFLAKYNITGSGDFAITIAKEGNTESFIEVNTLNNAADYRVMQIPQNMPYGENGVTCLDFLKGIQKKYNLVIYPSKKDASLIIIEPFVNWYNKGEVVDLTDMIRTDKPFTVIPANNLAVNELEFGDSTGKDYFSKLFTEQNNRTYGTSYFIDSDNQFSQGKIDVKTTLSSSPLRYINGSGGTGGTTPPITSYPINIYYNNNADDMCNFNRFYTTAYITRNDVEIEIYDTIYLDANLTTKLLGYNYVSDVSDKIWLVNPSTGVAYSNPRSC